MNDHLRSPVQQNTKASTESAFGHAGDTAGAIESKELGLRSKGMPAKFVDAPNTFWSRLAERSSELCSSILVKEARQSLKSKQFLWTYFLLLAGVGVWTLLGISFGGLQTEGSRAGEEILMGYWCILGFPLGIIIPFGAYRSMAREYEDGTIQLISITTMRPYQIVIGKFGSAVLQMLVYLSVMAPCILFTYLLRGIGLEQILIGLSIAIGGSLGLTILGLFLAGAVRSTFLGVGISVVFVLLLGWLYFLWCIFSIELTENPTIGLDTTEFVVIIFGMVACFGSTAALLLVAAASQISFPSDNRSTKIRSMMIVQQVFFFAWVVALIQMAPYQIEVFIIMILFACHYWLLMGFLMIGESFHISRRVQRALPKSMAARSLFSFLYPGPGRGYLLAVAMILSCALVLAIMAVFQTPLLMEGDEAVFNRTGRQNWPAGDLAKIIGSMSVCVFYAIFFLSVNFLFAVLIRPRFINEWPTGIGQVLSLFVGFGFVFLMTICALIFYVNVDRYGSNGDYSASQVFNWYWTVIEVGDGTRFSNYWLPFSMFALFACGTIATALFLASRELLQRPIPIPQRVAIEKNEPPKKLPVGESIEEIFGEI